MCRAFYVPQLFDARFGGIQAVAHPSRYERVFRTVNEQHGKPAFFYLLQWRGFPEIPTVTQACSPTGQMEQGKGGQAELVFQFSCVFIPHAGITAVFHKAVHERRLGFAAHAYGRSRSHGDMNLLNSDWGIYKTVNNTSLLSYKGGAYQFQKNGGKKLTDTYSNLNSFNSTYSIQFSVRYIFNSMK